MRVSHTNATTDVDSDEEFLRGLGSDEEDDNSELFAGFVAPSGIHRYYLKLICILTALLLYCCWHHMYIYFFCLICDICIPLYRCNHLHHSISALQLSIWLPRSAPVGNVHSMYGDENCHHGDDDDDDSFSFMNDYVNDDAQTHSSNMSKATRGKQSSNNGGSQKSVSGSSAVSTVRQKLQK